MSSPRTSWIVLGGPSSPFEVGALVVRRGNPTGCPLANQSRYSPSNHQCGAAYPHPSPPGPPPWPPGGGWNMGAPYGPGGGYMGPGGGPRPTVGPRPIGSPGG